jgi:putative two-component system hydrogenase maturation factor HypX/HoxX
VLGLGAGLYLAADAAAGVLDGGLTWARRIAFGLAALMLLPRRVGRDEAERLTDAAEPIGAQQAAQLGVVDRVLSGARDEFDRAVTAYAQQLATSSAITRLIETKEILRQADEAVHPLEGYRVAELARMRDDIFFDAHNFSALRHGFVCKHAAAPVPVRHVG